MVHPYYMEEELLMRYVEDNKQRFEVIVIPWDLSKVVLKLAHDDLGHNGSARTYMIVRRSYYWKGLRPDVVHYVKRCTVCRKHNSASPKYNKGTFQAPGAPMDFISMDLIGEFHPPSTHGNKYALTVICMLSGWTWCIPIPDKTAPVVIQAYLKMSTMFLDPLVKYCQTMVLSLVTNCLRLWPKSWEWNIKSIPLLIGPNQMGE